MRKLASIQKVKNIQPILGADNIVKCNVLGWEVVIKKDDFKEGDFCVYCEIDSLLPEKPEFEFLRDYKFRIKTIKLRGQVSQGICFPLSVLPKGCDVVEGLDVTDILGIKKYEPPLDISLQGIAKGHIPYFVPKTDEIRVQLLQDELNKFKGKGFFITEKLDGSSVSYYIKDNEFGVCSRNLELKESDDNLLWFLANKYNIKNKLLNLNKNIALQGEVVGPKVQGNKYKLNTNSIFFFKAFDIFSRSYLTPDEFRSLCLDLELSCVPYMKEELILGHSIAEFVNLSRGFSVLNNNIPREGIILISKDRINNGHIFSFKVVNPDFLLKFD